MDYVSNWLSKLTVFPRERLWRVTRPGEVGVLHLVVSEPGWVLYIRRREKFDSPICFYVLRVICYMLCVMCYAMYVVY